MAVKRSRQKREAIPVVLTPLQRKRLENLWFVYGNYGPKTTKGNHSFIQGLLERGEDERPCRTKGYIPTEECEMAVDKILGRNDAEQLQQGQGEGSREQQQESTRRLRLVATEQTKHLPIDPEMKLIIEEMRERQKKREMIDTDKPDAA